MNLQYSKKQDLGSNKNAEDEVVESIKRRSQIGEIVRRIRKNKTATFGLIMILVLIFTAVFANFLAPYHYDDQDLDRRFLKPSLSHLFGTDEFGRDIFSRVIYGSRISLLVGFIAVGISLILGGILGSIAGYYGGTLDNIIMRLMDIALSIPQILLAIAIAASLGPGLVNLMIAVGISSTPKYARVIRASILSIKNQEFIEAAKAVGCSDFRIITKHILPNCLAPIIVQTTFGVAVAILSAAALSFIGLGIQPPNPEWGAMLSRGRKYIRDYPHLAIFPGMAIMVVILALNLFGDGLRDATDPRLKD